jgi:hypothetical protein
MERIYFWVGVPDDQTSGFALEGGYDGYPSPLPCYYDRRRYGFHISKWMDGADYLTWEGLVYPGSLDGDNWGVTFLPTESGPPYYGSGYVMLRGWNTCGASSPVAMGYGQCGTLLFTPNPATNETILEISSIDGIEEEPDMEWEMEVYTETQVLKAKQTKLRGNKYKLQVGDWKEGVYIVRVKYGDDILQGKLIVKK